jgi:ribosomal-protein-alanine N-acetyltransferase
MLEANPTGSLHLRPFFVSDLPFSLEKDCFGPEAWNDSQILSQIESQYSLGIFSETSCLSYLFCLVGKLEAEILRIGTHPKFRRQGLGDQLLTHFINAHIQLDLFLEVAEDNLGAIRFYESKEFQIVDKRKGYYQNGRDAWVFKRSGKVS